MTKLYCVFCSKYRMFGKPNVSYILEKKYYLFLLFVVNVKNEDEKMFKKEEAIEILKILGLIKNL